MSNTDQPGDEREETRNERHRSAERRHWTFEKIGGSIALIFTAIAAAGAVASAVASFGAWKAANDAVHAAFNANEIAIRPYIKITLKPSTFNIRISPDRDYRNDLAGVKFRVENIGKTPALVYVESSSNWSGRGHASDENNWPSTEVVGRKFIFPEDKETELTSYVSAFTTGQLADLATDDKFYVMVDVRYGPLKNGFPSDIYETRVCTVFKMKRDANLVTLGDDYPCPSEDSNRAK
jgi:hypothetical protein